jgi:HEAT repeat protein
MKKIVIGLIALLLVPAGARADQTGFRTVPSRTPLAEAPEAWNQQDPADSLYRSAREAMNQRSHERAAELFHRIWNRHPRSTYAPDALYWEAFNRYRLDEEDQLEEALKLLAMQRERYAEASTRRNGDAPELETRIQGILARRGNEDAAREIVIAAREMAGVGAEIGVRVAEEVARAMEGLEFNGQMLAEELAALAERGVVLGRGLGHSDTDDLPQECREDAETRLAALSALMNMNAERALPVLRRVMESRDECSVVLRRRAVFLIADKQTPETVDLLLDAANNDPDMEVRRQAVFWLSEVDDPRAVNALARFVAESDDDEVRERAIFALSQHGSPEAMNVVRGVARDRNTPTRLRKRAIFWLAEEGSREDLEALKTMFSQETDPEIAERILFAVGQTERPEDARWLMSVAADEGRDPELRSKAIFWAAEAGISANELGQLYGRIQNRQIKERIIFGLAESSEPGAIDRLIEIARTETDSELRTRAIFWLGNSDDERAAEVLLEILADPGGGG